MSYIITPQGKQNGYTWVCQEKGCHNTGIDCYLPSTDYTDYYGTLYGKYCYIHAPMHGFCAGCGTFWGGIEAFDISPSGLCEHCKYEYEDNYDYDDSDDYDLDYDCDYCYGSYEY